MFKLVSDTKNNGDLGSSLILYCSEAISVTWKHYEANLKSMRLGGGF